MKNYSKGQIWLRLARIRNVLGISVKDQEKILGMEAGALARLMNIDAERLNKKDFPLGKMEELESLIRLSDAVLPRGEFKRWLKKEHLPIYVDSCPLNYLKQGDYEMVRYSLKMEDF